MIFPDPRHRACAPVDEAAGGWPVDIEKGIFHGLENTIGLVFSGTDYGKKSGWNRPADPVFLTPHLKIKTSILPVYPLPRPWSSPKTINAVIEPVDFSICFSVRRISMPLVRTCRGMVGGDGQIGISHVLSDCTIFLRSASPSVSLVWTCRSSRMSCNWIAGQPALLSCLDFPLFSLSSVTRHSPGPGFQDLFFL